MALFDTDDRDYMAIFKAPPVRMPHPLKRKAGSPMRRAVRVREGLDEYDGSQLAVAAPSTDPATSAPAATAPSPTPGNAPAPAQPAGPTAGAAGGYVRPPMDLLPLIPDRGTHAESIFFARLSRAAYTADRPDYDAGLLPVGWRDATELSDDPTHRRVYVKERVDGKKAVVIAFRGTIRSDVSDLNADRHIALGSEDDSRRFQDALTLTKKMIDIYGKDNVIVTGHSLGGAEALYASKHLGVRGTAFNPGSSPLQLVKAVPPIYTGMPAIDSLLAARSARQRNGTADSSVYVTGSDPISVSSRFSGYQRVSTVAVKPGRGAHDLENFFIV